MLKSFLTKSLELYRLGLGQDRSWSWVTALIDSHASADEKEISHRCVLFEKRVPVLVRADQTDFGVAVELQIPGSGWGYMDAIERSMRFGFSGSPIGVGFAEGFVEAMIEIARLDQVRVLHANNASRYTRERSFFAARCNEFGQGRITAILSDPWILALTDADVLRRCFLDDLLKFRGIEELLQLYFSGKIVIEPPPCLLYDQKISVVLPFDPRSRAVFSDDERGLFPETYLVRPEFVPEIDGRHLSSWLDLADLEGPSRSWILKYAGSDPKRRGGAVEVWNLSAEDSNRLDVQRLIASALTDWKNGEPWLVQRRIKRKFDVTYLDLEEELRTERLYARITPMYSLGIEPRLVAVAANLRRMWKVHGQKAREDDPNVLLAVHRKE